MDLLHLIRLAITASVLLLAFALGLRATAEEATYLVRRPARFARALLAMFVIVPATALFLAKAFEFHRPVEIALLAVAVSPVPPILPGKQLKLGGRAAYVYGLLIAMSVAAIVVVPLAVRVLGRLFRLETDIPFAEVAKLLGITVLAPVVGGLLVRRVAPGLAERVGPIASTLGTVLLVAGLLPVLVKSLPAIWALVGNGTILAMAAVVAVALAAGHALGGPFPADRRSLAIASSMRHPGIALAIARLNFPEEILVPAAVLLFVLLATIATSAYGKRYTGAPDGLTVQG